ncbi:hypothetical protein PanWU01x14_107460 [Parasponia andersonii]|uniref:Membrane-associated kinase regulator n=1 Tax=Parasponia andersonii TaxID=3476 RepID=A0A2P5D078_PARAD|nr:hypothetical protein PanWU01x14_107460 [Parasponia andersonii]
MEKVRDRDHTNSDDHDHQEEEVSLCDLPLLSLMQHQENDNNKPPNAANEEYDAKNDETTEEFAFGTSACSGSLSTVSEMCAADEVFFRGQILPLRLSVSSDAGPTRLNDPHRKFESRSESMDHGGLRSISSRSSSCSNRSTQHSPSSAAATISITRVTSEPKLRNINQFHAHPSPKPQIRTSSARLERLGSTSSASRKHKSSIWDFFRLGLVRTPDIELQEVNKVNFIRTNSRANSNSNNISKGSSSSPSVSRNSSVTNSDNSKNVTNSSSTNGENANGVVSNVAEKQKRRKFLSRCKCSADTVAPNVIMVKSTTPNSTSGAKHGMSMTKEKVVLVHQDPKTTSLSKKNKQNQNQDQKRQHRQKQATSHHRTYEWLKELSHASLAMHV